MTKKGYRKPRVEIVRLKAEEAVLTGCKTLLGLPGPGGLGQNGEPGQGCFVAPPVETCFPLGS